jgi:predicted permease
MSNLLADVRYALRMLRKSPVFTIVAMLSIALGIGANTAIFTLLDQALLRMLPVKNPQDLVLVRPNGPWSGSNWGDGNQLSFPMYVDFRDHNDVFDGMFCRFAYDMHVGFGGKTERISAEIVSGTYFPVLGVRPALGRLIGPDDDKAPGAHPVAVLQYGYWKSRFSADPSVIGQKLIINDHPMEVIGVTEEGFNGDDLGTVSQVWVPMMMKAQMTPGWDALDDRHYRWVTTFGRLKPGVSKDQAQAHLQPYYRSLLELELQDASYFARSSAASKARYVTSKIETLPGSAGKSTLQRVMTRPLWILMAIVAGVLLIACANVANLLLARATARQREIALRLALGASRVRIVQQLLIESVLLAVLGGAAGLLLSTWGAHALLGFFVDPEQPVTISATPDLRILAFNFLVALLTGLLFGLVPALQSTRPALAPTLKDSAGAVLGGGHVRLRKALVATQVALSLLLLIGAGLFIRSLNKLMAVDAGFKTANMLTFGVDPALNGYSAVRAKQYFRDLLQRLDSTPGVAGAGFATVGLLEGNQWSSTVTVEGYPRKEEENMNPLCNGISPGYFKAMGIPLLAGREFDARDDYTRPPAEPGSTVPRQRTPYRVAIANETFAKRHLGGVNTAIGKHVGFGGNPGTPTPIEIVGIVKDSKYTGLRDETQRQLFFPELEDDTPGNITIYLRTDRDPDTMFQTLRRVVQQIDPNVPIYGMRTVEFQVAQSLRVERFVTSLSSIFSLLATSLAMIGLYGVMAYTVTRRTREIGVRMALGALTGNIAWLIMREVVVLVTIGMAIGLPAAWYLSRYVESQLFGVTTLDPTAISAAILGLAAIASIAGLIPALRATRVNPVIALRYE